MSIEGTRTDLQQYCGSGALTELTYIYLFLIARENQITPREPFCMYGYYNKTMYEGKVNETA